MSRIQQTIVAFHSKLNEFKENEKYCDVTIHVDGKSFKCHRLALSIAGEYFEKMFYGNFRESREDVVVLHDVNVIAFEEILRYVYTGDILLTEDNIIDVITASEFFKLDRIQDLCIRYIKRTLPMTSTTMYELFVFACSSGKKSLINTLSRFIMEFFEDYYDDIKFLKLDYDDLNLLVSQHWYLSPRNEYMLLDSLVRWVNHEAQNRRKYSEKLINVIDFQLISASCAKLILTKSLSEAEKYDEGSTHLSFIRSPETTSVNSGVNYEKPELGLHVYMQSDDGNYHIYSMNRCTSGWKESFLEQPIFKHRKGIGVRDYLYCFDDWLTFQAYSSIDDVAFPSLKSPPSAKLDKESTVDLYAMKNFIYLYNRNNSNIWTEPSDNWLSIKNGTISQSMCCYNIEKDEWFSVPRSETENDANVSIMAGCDKVLYLFTEGENFVQMLDDRASSKWQKLITTHKCSTYETCCSHNGKIYVAFDKQIECFDPVALKWSKLKPTNSISTICHLVLYENWLWAFGEEIRNGSLEPCVIEVYNTSIGQWNPPPCWRMDATKIRSKFHIKDVVIFKP